MEQNTQKYLELEGLKIPVEIVSKRPLFGRVDVLVIPVGGSGEKWVAEDKVIEADKKLAKKIVR